MALVVQAALSRESAPIGEVAVVKNTFLHFSADEEEEEELVERKRSERKAKTEPVMSQGSLETFAPNSEDGDALVTELEETRSTPLATAGHCRQDKMDAEAKLQEQQQPPTPSTPSAPSTPSTPSAPSAPLTIARGLTCVRTAAGGARLEWSVEERRISGQDKMFVSPGFRLSLPSLGSLPFKLILHAAVGQKKGKGSQGFRSAEGWGRVELKCCDDVSAEAELGLATVALSVGVGSGDYAQPFRGPVVHNLALQGICGLKKGMDIWHLHRSINPATRHLLLHVIVEPVRRLGEASW